MTHLYYAEDDETIARIVKEYLEQKNCTVTIFSENASVRQALSVRQPDLVLIDWNMPDGRGDSLCRWIRTRWPELPVIFLTVRDDTRDIVAGFENGADDYVVKPFDLDVLHSRILALLRRTGQQAPTRFCCGPLTLDTEKMSVFYEKEEISLSQPEYQIFTLLMTNIGRTITRRQLLEYVWDADGNYVNDNTLTVTIKRLREKLHNPVCLKTIRSFGYRMEDSL